MPRARPPACCARPPPGTRRRRSPLRASASSTARSRTACARRTRADVTGIHDFQREHGLAAWQRLHADARLTLRVWASLPAERLGEIIALGLRSGLGDDWLRIGPVKAFADGTLGSRTASMLEPFADAGLGEPLLSAEELRDARGPLRRRGPRPRGARDRRRGQPRGARRARGDPRALGAARPAAAHRARAAAPPGRPRAASPSSA